MKENPTVNYAKMNEEANSKMFNVRDEYKDNSYEKNVEICKSDRLPFSVGVINLTGELNVGMMLRSACLFGAENFYIFGRKKFDKRSTVGAEKYINIVQYSYDDPIHADELILTDIKGLWQSYHNIVLCERGGYDLSETKWSEILGRFDCYHSPLFLFGSESHGIPENIINFNKCVKVSIPQRGVLRSFNVSAAMNIICWDYIKDNCL
jgi:tRNA G18 (ribose-2'-O)-methylase SpoU